MKAYNEVTKASLVDDIGSSWLSVLCRLREDEVYSSESQTTRKETPTMSTPKYATGKRHWNSKCIPIKIILFSYQLDSLVAGQVK